MPGIDMEMVVDDEPYFYTFPFVRDLTASQLEEKINDFCAAMIGVPDDPSVTTCATLLTWKTINRWNKAALAQLQTRPPSLARSNLPRLPPPSQCMAGGSILYHRIPKTGSSTFTILIGHLAHANHFARVELDESYWNVHIMESIVQAHMNSDVEGAGTHWAPPRNEGDISAHLKFILQFGGPTFIDAHHPFINLEANALSYVSIVRDPIKRVISDFKYFLMREGGTLIPLVGATASEASSYVWVEEFNRLFINSEIRNIDDCVADVACLQKFVRPACREQTRFLCGNSPGCKVPFGTKRDSQRQVQLAMRNVETAFCAVFPLERFEDSLPLLQHRLPHIFRHAPHLKVPKLRATATKAKPSPKTLQTLQAICEQEGDGVLYRMISKKFEGELRALQEQ
jgi:hypothetical protein